MSTAKFARTFEFSEASLHQIGVRLSERRPVITSGMLRKARAEIREADAVADVSTAPVEILRQGFYGHATMFSASLTVDAEGVRRLREGIARRFPGA